MKKFRSLVSVFAAFCLLVSGLPLAASAQGATRYIGDYAVTADSFSHVSLQNDDDGEYLLIGEGAQVRVANDADTAVASTPIWIEGGDEDGMETEVTLDGVTLDSGTRTALRVTGDHVFLNLERDSTLRAAPSKSAAEDLGVVTFGEQWDSGAGMMQHFGRATVRGTGSLYLLGGTSAETGVLLSYGSRLTVAEGKLAVTGRDAVRLRDKSGVAVTGGLLAAVGTRVGADVGGDSLFAIDGGEVKLLGRNRSGVGLTEPGAQLYLKDGSLWVQGGEHGVSGTAKTTFSVLGGSALSTGNTGYGVSLEGPDAKAVLNGGTLRLNGKESAIVAQIWQEDGEAFPADAPISLGSVKLNPACSVNSYRLAGDAAAFYSLTKGKFRVENASSPVIVGATYELTVYAKTLAQPAEEPSPLYDDDLEPAEKPEPSPEPSPEPGWKNPFTDVSEKDWFYEAVKFANEEGLLVGTGKGKFQPETAMTRAMLAAVLYRMEGSPEVKVTGRPFDDVKTGEYYTEAVVWAKENGIIYGTSAKKFSPDNKITREDLACFLFRYAEYLKLGTSAQPIPSGFKDAGKISRYAKDAMAWCITKNIISGVSKTTLSPKGLATRAQVSSMLMRFSALLETK